MIRVVFAMLLLAATAPMAQDFADAALEGAVRKAIGVPEGPIPAARLAAANFDSLDASNLRIRDLSGIEQCTSLKTLNLSFNALTDIGALSALTALESLDLHFNQVADVSSLAELTGLRRLGLLNNQVADFAPLSGLQGLESLACGGNVAGNLDALRGLTALEELELSASGLNSLALLSGMAQLRVLRVPENSLRSVEGIAAFSQLRVLDLRRNVIMGLGPLRDCAALAELNAEGNPLNQAALCEVIPALQAKAVTVKATGACEGDTDADGLADAYESMSGLDPRLPDSDGDGLADGAELWEHRTDPVSPDTDGDGMPDGFEVAHGLAPLENDADGDADGDGVSNGLEHRFETSPQDATIEPTPGKLEVSATEVTLRDNVPWAPFTIRNAGQLALSWQAKSSHENVRVVRLATEEMATLVSSRMPPLFWGLSEVGETVSEGTGADSLYVLGTSFEVALDAEVTITNAENPEEQVVIVAQLHPRAGAEKVSISTVVSPPGGGTVFKEPAGTEHVPGTEIQLGAVAGTGFSFVRWEGAVVDATAATTTVTAEEDAIIVAVFEAEKGGLFGCAAQSAVRADGAGNLVPMLLALLLLGRAGAVHRSQ